MNPEILQMLQTLQVDNEPVRLLNNYYGLPVSYEGLIKEVAADYMRVIVHPHQAVSMMIEASTYITHPQMPFVLRSTSIQVDYATLEAVLNEILFTTDSIGSRVNVRVQPVGRVQVVVNTARSSAQGELLDISEVGAGVCTFAALIYNPLTLKRGAHVTLQLDLEEISSTLEVAGEVLYTLREGENHRLGIKIQPDEQAKKTIHQFIGQRKVALLNELQALVEAHR